MNDNHGNQAENGWAHDRMSLSGTGYARYRVNRQMKRVLSALSILGVAFLICFASYFISPGIPGHAKKPPKKSPSGRVVLFVMDRLGIDDIAHCEAPNLKKLISQGSVGLMNARIKHDQYGSGSYLAIGTGNYVAGGSNAGFSFDSSESFVTPTGVNVDASNLFEYKTEKEAPSGSVVNPFIEEMKPRSSAYVTPGTPGALGGILKNSGKRVSVIGNADTFTIIDDEVSNFFGWETGLPGENPYRIRKSLHREAATIAMDSSGITNSGEVALKTPHTYISNLVAYTENILSGNLADFLVVELGQTSRVDEFQGFLSENMLAKKRKAAILECDQAIGEISRHLDPSSDLVIICSPTPSRKMIDEGELLTPIIIAGRGFEPSSFLYSSSTRKKGLASNFDIAATIIDFFKLERPPQLIGRPLVSAETSYDAASLEGFRDVAVASHTSRGGMVNFFIFFSLAVIALLLLVIIMREDLAQSRQTFFSVVFLALISAPLAYLVVSLFGRADFYKSIPIAAVMCIGLALASLFLQPRRNRSLNSAIIFLSGLTLVALIADTFSGSKLMASSPFGTDLILGGRYYGIGNLYMGVAIGSSLLFVSLIIDTHTSFFSRPRRRLLFACAVFALVLVLIGLPTLGANVGGAITAAVAFGVFLIKLGGERLKWKRALWVVILLIAFLLILPILEMYAAKQPTHLGELVSRIKGGGLPFFFSQVSRKVAASIRLLKSSNWTLELVVLALGFFLLNWKYHFLRDIKEGKPALYAGLLAMAVGLIAAIIFNDSGIEAASLISLYLFLPYLIPGFSREKGLGNYKGKSKFEGAILPLAGDET